MFIRLFHIVCLMLISSLVPFGICTAVVPALHAGADLMEAKPILDIWKTTTVGTCTPQNTGFHP